MNFKNKFVFLYLQTLPALSGLVQTFQMEINWQAGETRNLDQ